MSRVALKLVVCLVTAGSAALVAGPAFATAWTAHLAGGSSGESKATTLPTAPTTASATCQSSTGSKIIVSWSAVAKATAYSVYESTASATGTYSSVATGVSGTSWTSGSLTTGNYWFEVSASIGANWGGSRSSATGETTIATLSCVQP